MSKGELTTIEMRPDFAKICEANATLFYGYAPSWWYMIVGDLIRRLHTVNHIILIVLCSIRLDPWNRLEQAHRVIAPGGVLTCYVTTTTSVKPFG